MSHRLFIALRPPPELRTRLALVQSGVAGARWQSDAQLHLTLRFLGAVERPQAEDIAAMLSALHAAPVTLSVKGVGHFGHGERLEAIWAGVAPHDAVTALHHKVDRLMQRAGCAPDGRAFLPHITLARFSSRARVADARDWLGEHGAITSAPFTCDGVILFESHLGSEGAVYREVARVPLG